MPTIDRETTKDQARKLLGSRIGSITELVITRKRFDEVREQLAEAGREDSKAHVRATRDGWSKDEVKKLGLDNSAAVMRRRRLPSTDSGQSAL